MSVQTTILRICALVALVIGTSVFAESKIAVMNYQAVLFNSAAANDATLQLRSVLAPEQNKLQDIKLQLETRQSRLTTDKDILTEEEIIQFQQEMQALVGEQNQISARMQQAQQNSRNAFIQQYQPVIREIVSAYVKEQGLTLVIDSQAVLWNESEPDLTEQMLQQFDALYLEQKAQSVPAE